MHEFVIVKSEKSQRQNIYHICGQCDNGSGGKYDYSEKAEARYEKRATVRKYKGNSGGSQKQGCENWMQNIISKFRIASPDLLPNDAPCTRSASTDKTTGSKTHARFDVISPAQVPFRATPVNFFAARPGWANGHLPGLTCSLGFSLHQESC